MCKVFEDFDNNLYIGDASSNTNDYFWEVKLTKMKLEMCLSNADAKTFDLINLFWKFWAQDISLSPYDLKSLVLQVYDKLKKYSFMKVVNNYNYIN